MEHYKMRTTVIFLLILFLFMSCWNNNKKKEGFYDYSQTMDLYRLPLIEPFQIISADKGHSWIFKRLNNEDVVNNVGIMDSTIVVYSKRTALPGMMTQAWFVLNANSKEEKVFTSENDYKVYLKAKGIEDLKLHDINAVFTDFDKNKRLPSEWPEQSSVKK